MSRVYRPDWCRKPERGYYCTFADGHLGHCDIWPEWYLDLWWQVSDMFWFVKKKVFVKSVRRRKRKQ